MIAAARRGESRALVLAGEAGIGKTALLDYLVSKASGCRVVRVAGIQSEAELGFAALHQLCGPLLDRRDRLPEPQRNALETVFGLQTRSAPDRLLIGLAVLSLLAEAAHSEPLVCVVDDAHWLDRASAQALAFAARRLVAESVALVFARRTTESAPELDGLPTLTVDGIDDGAARDLLRSTLPIVVDEQVRDRIIAETRGNPLAILELPHGLTSAELASGLFVGETHGFTDQLEMSFARRTRSLPDDTQRLLLVAAADSVGGTDTVRRAAVRLGIELDAARPAADAGLWEFGATVRFRHPLVRSAVYRAADDVDRREVHSALAEVTEDAARRAWHRAQAASAPDENLAAELERSAGDAQRRGGYAQAVAFLQQASRMTPDAARRAQRDLEAARAARLAGDIAAAFTALGAARAGPLDELGRVQAELIRGQLTFAIQRDSEGARALLDVARQAESIDTALARDVYLEALLMTSWAGRSADDLDLREIADAYREMPASRTDAKRPRDLILDGVAALMQDGYAAAAPELHRAVGAYENEPGSEEQNLPWLSLSFMVACLLWDDEGWYRVSAQYLESTRSSGALSLLPAALDYRVYTAVFGGELSLAAALVEEATAVLDAIGYPFVPYGAGPLYALQGRVAETRAILEESTASAESAGGRLRLTHAQWATAMLYNGLGEYQRALPLGQYAADYDQALTASPNWALVEVVEAAAHVGDAASADDAMQRLTVTTRGAGTDWGLGIEARSRALLASPAEAETLYREATERLGRTRNRPDLARAHLLYGEWLRRQRRQLDARTELQTAHELFLGMGMAGFADRAARELRATGVTPRKRSVEAGGGLTAQETQVARLVSEGLSNSEVATRLFLSPKTVEYHLRKVFTKMRVTSRRELRGALGEMA